MDPDALDRQLSADRRDGLKPWLVVASAGTTSTGSIDPLAPLADVAQRHDVWFHVDGAYGGLYRLCPELGEALDGLERADSVVVDPHKTLFLPYGTGAVLVRDEQRLADSFDTEAGYLPARETGQSPADLGLELTRPFRGLALWLPLQLCGVGAFRTALAEKLALARSVREHLAADPRFEVHPGSDLTVVAFRVRVPAAVSDEVNRDVEARLRNRGVIFLSGTRIGGTVWLRLVVQSVHTHRAHVTIALEELSRVVEDVVGRRGERVASARRGGRGR